MPPNIAGARAAAAMGTTWVRRQWFVPKSSAISFDFALAGIVSPLILPATRGSIGVFSFLAASENVAFVTAILLMLLIGVVQLVGLGDHLGGDADLHLDADGDLDLLGWLGFGRLPLLMLLIVFLALFGILGLMLQQGMHDWAGGPLNPWIAVPAVAAVSLPLTGLAARGLARILPRDFTTAVPLEVLIGTTAQIVIGRATPGSPARARAEDPHGQTHYVMVEPDIAGQIFEEGERVLLVRREGECFRAISRGDFRLPSLEI